MTTRRKVIVSVTPLPLDRDTRTLKIAASFARAGYRSIIVENRPSAAEMPPEVEVVTLRVVPRRPSTGRARSPGSEDPATWLKNVLRPFAPRWLRERVHFLTFVAAYYGYRPLVNATQVPPADLYYLHEYRLYPLLKALCRRRGVPLVYDAHDYYPGVYEDETLSPFWKKRFLPLLVSMERDCIENAEAIVTTSSGMGKLIESHFGVQPFLLSNSHDSRLEQTPQIGLRERAGLKADDFIIAVVGNRKPGQALEPLIDALGRLPDSVHVVIVGRYHEETVQMAHLKGVQVRLHWVGAVPPREIVPFLRSADAAALPYYAATENVRHILPNGLFHSVAAGLPLLYPDLPEIKRVIGAREVGLELDPRDATSMFTAIDFLIRNQDIARTFRTNLAALADETSWQREEDAVLDLVSDLIAKTR